MRTMTKFLLTFLMALTFGVTGAAAQNLGLTEQAIAEMNRIKPLQNPNWERSADVLKSRILDRKNKVIGELQDIAITSSGSINALKVDLNRLQLGDDVYLNYNNMNIRSANRAFILGFEEEKVEEFYPDLLANIETAAGESADSMSVRNLINSDVKAQDGRNLGKVEEVMFDDSGAYIQALVIRIRYKTVGGESVAIPFSMAEYTPSGGNRFNVTLADDKADALLNFAKER